MDKLLDMDVIMKKRHIIPLEVKRKKNEQKELPLEVEK